MTMSKREKADRGRVVRACLGGDVTCPGILEAPDKRCEHFVCGRDRTAVLWRERLPRIPAGGSPFEPRSEFEKVAGPSPARAAEMRRACASPLAADQWDDRLWRRRS